MFRTRGAVVLVVAAALTAGACGGTEWNAGRKPKPPSPVQTRAAAAAEAKAEVPYVNALFLKYPSGPATATDTYCFATAVIHGFGTHALAAHGLTVSDLRSPRTTLSDLPAPTPAQEDTIGAAVQRCGLSLIGASIGRGLGTRDAKAAACLSQALVRPEARRFLALTILDREQMSFVTAHNVVDLVARCVDLAAFLVRSLGLPADPTFRQCITNALRGVDSDVKNYMTLVLARADREQVQQSAGALGVAINQCRAGATTGFTVPPS